MNFDDMRKLVQDLNFYTKMYDEGHPVISDELWDQYYFQLQEMEKESGVILANSPTNHIDYQVVNKLNKVEHNHPMLSLDKTKSEEEVAAFLGTHEGIAMAKMDGLTCSITYENGNLVRAETRGNGIIGEDITHNISFVKGVPAVIPVDGTVVVDGEVICTYDDFDTFSDEYKNPRNFASGSIRLLDARVSAQRKLSFIVWDCIEGLGNKTLGDKLYVLGGLGFDFVPYLIVEAKQVHHAIILIKEWAKDFGYPIDGIVFKYNDCDYYNSLGATEHHFRGGLAFKFYDEEYETTLKNIEWSLGKTGQITPVALFEDVDFGDSVVNRASLHNLNIMNQILGKPYVGQKIFVAKQNMIIPQVKSGDKSDDGTTKEYIQLPDICPVCGHPVVIKDDFIYCVNDNCEGVFVNRLDHFVGKKGLDIKGLSKTTLQKLIDWGWVNNLKDIFNLSNFEKEWKTKPGFGEKSVMNILTAIDGAKDCELWQFISSLGIPLIGSTYAKEISKKEVDWHNFREDVEGNFDFTHWDGFGYEMDYSLNNFDYDEADELTSILNLKNSLWIDPDAKVEMPQSEVNGKNFVITGSLTHYKNRDLLQKDIEAHGGKVLKSVTGNTDYLVNNDITSGSSKNVKAKQLGIPIITEDQLIAMF